MTTIDNAAQPGLSFQPESRIRITDLSPHRNDLHTLFIAAQVVLIWPYSSSTRKFSLLLSEADARPLKGRKQVKVTFLNGAARATQQSRVGIGDLIRLQLRGCHWAQTEDLISTPGKRIDWDIQFRKDVAFEVHKQGSAPQRVQYQTTGTPSPAQSPAVNGVIEVSQDLQLGTPKIPIPYLTPSARDANRTSSIAYFDSGLDPFAEDREYVFGRSRKRTKFARPSSDWKLVDDNREDEAAELASPLRDRGQGKAIEVNTPVEEVGRAGITSIIPQVIDLISSDVETSGERPDLAATAPPVVQDPRIPSIPAKPIGEPTQNLPQFIKPQTPVKGHERLQLDLDKSVESSAALTPRLMPMPSPGLPLVSPLIRHTGVESGYFPTFDTTTSELDATGRSEDGSEDERRSSIAVSSESSSNASLVILDEPPKQVYNPIPVSAIGSNVVEDEDMYGAPRSTQVPKAIHDSPPQRARDALDVLEEFLQISPTVPQEPYHVQNKAELEVLGGLRARVEQKSDSSVKGVEEDVTDEKEHARESPSNHFGQTTGRQDSDVESSRPQSRALSLDGAADEEETGAPEYVKVLQDLQQDRKSRQTAPPPLEIAARNNHMEVKSAINEASHALNENRTQLLSPKHTQEELHLGMGIPPPQLPREETAFLPTPDNTQSQPQPPSLQATPSLSEIAIDDPNQVIEPAKQEKEDRLSRRISQRLSRKSIGPDNISSPYFTPRKIQVVPSSPIQIEAPTQSSPPLEEPTSPTRRVTRSQKPILQGPTEQQLIREVDEIEPSAYGEPDATPKRGTTTSMSYYPRLASLREHFGQSVDIIALAVDESSQPERAKSGPKDHHTTLRIVDPSVDNGTRTAVQVFRQFRQALPTTHRGDVVILRNFKVQTAKHKWMLLSTDSSAWAVFSKDTGSRLMIDEAEMSGPPVEYGRGETAQVKELTQWWQEYGEDAFPAFSKNSTQAFETSGELRVDVPKTTKVAMNEDDGVLASIEPPPLSPRRTRRRANMTDNFGNEEDAPGAGPATSRAASMKENTTPTSVRHQPPRKAKSKTPAPAPGPAPTNVSANNGGATPHRSVGTSAPEKDDEEWNTSPATANCASAMGSRKASGRKEPSLVHELRDGTKYVDDDGQQGSGVVHELRDGTSYVDQ